MVFFFFFHGCSESSLLFIYFQSPAILLGNVLVFITLHKIFFYEAWHALSICKFNSFSFLENSQIYTLSIFFFSWNFDFLLGDSYIHIISPLTVFQISDFLYKPLHLYFAYSS